MGGTKGQVEAMRAGLARDGCAEDGLTIYLTPNYEIFKLVKNALFYMRLKNYDNETMARFSWPAGSPRKRRAAWRSRRTRRALGSRGGS
jgi:hypothetical protein